MKAVHWLSPGDPAQRTGGYLYNRRMIEGLRERGWTVVVHPLPGTWPWPDEQDRAACAAELAQIGDGAPVVADGLCWTGLHEAGAELARRCPVTVIVHSPLHAEAAEAGVRARERAALRGVRPVVTSARTAEALGIEAEVLIPGTDPTAGRARRVPEGPVGLLTVATVTRRKGHDVLLRALARLERADWVLRCAGAARDRAWAAQVRTLADELGLTDRVAWLGDLDAEALEAAYAEADVLVQPARYEAYGMALTEGMARGLAVISTPAGALDGVAPEAWVRVEPDDEDGLARALTSVVGRVELRERLATAALQAAGSLPTWADQADRLAELLRGREG